MLSVDELHDRSNATAEAHDRSNSTAEAQGGCGCIASECCVSYACQLHTPLCNHLGLGLPKPPKKPTLLDTAAGFGKFIGISSEQEAPADGGATRIRAWQGPRGGGATIFLNIG